MSGNQVDVVTRVGASLQTSRTRIKLNRRSYDSDQLKTHLRGPGKVLRSRLPDLVHQEMGAARLE